MLVSVVVCTSRHDHALEVPLRLAQPQILGCLVQARHGVAVEVLRVNPIDPPRSTLADSKIQMESETVDGRTLLSISRF